ncbi:hypothetical protein Vadar_015253 [Vaccinium darrowii]|uniref:Uncharacterized protein n=1 Tax=Vaccinium darrowii TaxID=229202 RepID=A0ACB7YLT2_9ERIC|nr:hypothetical protein Vadar_015253 [Vaccinium darrowii]
MAPVRTPADLAGGRTGSLNAVEVSDTPRSGINGLVSSFVKLLQILSVPSEIVHSANLNDVKNGQLSAEAFGAKCCLSYQFQILPKEPSSVEHFYSVLPQPIIILAKNDN